MRTGLLLALLGVGATPAALYTFGDEIPVVGPDLDDLLHGRTNLSTFADEVARKFYTPSARLDVIEVESKPTRTGAFGETIKADPGYTFYHVRVRLINNGSVDFAASTWHFSAEDELGSDHPVKVDQPHHDFDGSRLRKGAFRDGTLVFHMPKDTTIAAILWTGDFAQARGVWPPLAPEAGEGNAAAESRP